ncbi:MAG: cation transporter [Candidatus Rokubacteria bacterium]|nr:cation transporter [Candidatus Rokubacteria bacterium]
MSCACDGLAHRPEAARAILLRTGVRLEWFTIGWNSVEAVVAIGAGLLAGSIALVGFGLDSVIETTAGLMVLWRLRREVVGAHGDQVERAERAALKFVGLTFLALALYVLYESGRKLWSREAPAESWVGIGLAICSVIVMPLLAMRKRSVARALGSRALAADAVETLVCSYLSLTLLLGLGLNAFVGWWWADPLAALAMLPLIFKEGVEALGGDACAEGARCACACCVPVCQPPVCVCAPCTCC